MNLSVRFVGLFALAALVPLGIYLVDSAQADATSAVLTALNVVLIAGSLYLLFGDAPSDSAHGGSATQ